MVVPVDTPLAQRRNTLHGGTHVVSGTGLALVVAVGADTAFGAIAAGLQQAPADTEFEHGVRRFGALLLEVTLLLVLAIFAFNVFLQRPVAQSFLFALALGVGLTPQLLPARSPTLARRCRKILIRCLRQLPRRLYLVTSSGRNRLYRV
jgi:Mg2+-importing ATPase